MGLPCIHYSFDFIMKWFMLSVNFQAIKFIAFCLEIISNDGKILTSQSLCHMRKKPKNISVEYISQSIRYVVESVPTFSSNFVMDDYTPSLAYDSGCDSLELSPP